MSSTVKFKQWNAPKFINKVVTALEKVGAVYLEETTLQISNPIWNWNWDTLRAESLLMGGQTEAGKPGVIVRAGNRDIVDTGNLLDSVTAPAVSKSSGQAVLRIAWTAPYAAKVLGGGVYGSYVNVRGQIVNVGNRPGRNWIKAAYAAKPPAQVFANIWRSTR